MKKSRRVRFTKCSTRGCTKQRPTRDVKDAYTCHGGRCPVERKRRKK